MRKKKKQWTSNMQLCMQRYGEVMDIPLHPDDNYNRLGPIPGFVYNISSWVSYQAFMASNKLHSDYFSI